jgi:hypothetical protein
MSDQLTPPWHPGIHYAGKELQWLPTDTEEHFNQLITNPEHREYFAQQGWLEPDAITYKINSEGFRSDEFEDDALCMIALGCSYTAGIGLPYEVLWPTLVGQQLGLKIYNLAWGGNSADTCFRIAQYWISQLKPTVVCMLTPPLSRLELITDTGTSPPVEVFLPASKSVIFNKDDIFLKHWFLNNENAKINNIKNKLAITELCRQNNAWFCSLESNDYMSQSRESVGYARDYMHAGPIAHNMVADKILIEYEKYNSSRIPK